MKATRRSFLSAAGAVGLSTVYPESASAKIEPEPWGIKLGIATYTYRKFERAKAIEFIKAVKTPWISIKADQPPKAGANQHLPGLPPRRAASFAGCGSRDPRGARRLRGRRHQDHELRQCEHDEGEIRGRFETYLRMG
jgi:hypothetical protein